ncbi:hypothetical protein OPQ81_002500 [Rhizoctonia solani]|nr:hypothetical protein OPQ81_002500 [Rhizoctonia solani]
MSGKGVTLFQVIRGNTRVEWSIGEVRGFESLHSTALSTFNLRYLSIILHPMEEHSGACSASEPCTISLPASPAASEFSSKTSIGDQSLTSIHTLEDHLIQNPAFLPRSPSPSQKESPVPLNVCHLPEEILIDIFFLVLNHASPGTPRERPFERTVQPYYKQLFILLSVCSDWRRICQNRGAFWSLISARKYWKTPESIINLCLERAQGSDLHLDGELGDVPNSRLLEIITAYGSRTRTLNLSGENPEILRTTVTSLLGQSKPGHISSLFLRNDRNTLDDNSHHTWPFLFPLASPEYTLLNGFTDSLKALRLSGFRLDWGQAGFSKLVELKIQHICFDSLSEIADLLHTIAASPQLKRVQMNDLRCHLDDINTQRIDRPGSLPVFHPSLQFLFLKNIRWSLLILILRSIIPGGYKIAIGYSRRVYLRRYPKDLDVLRESVLQSFNIDTLMISRNWAYRSHILHYLLEAMPTIQALSISHGEFVKETFQALIRPVESSMDGNRMFFPTIRRLHIMGSTFEPLDLDGLKEVVDSHAIQELKLGGSIEELKSDPEHTPTLERSVRFEDPKDDEHTAPMKAWLGENVPKFSLVRRLEDLPDFDFQCYDW